MYAFTGLIDIYSALHLGRDREKTEQEQTPPGHLVLMAPSADWPAVPGQ